MYLQIRSARLRAGVDCDGRQDAVNNTGVAELERRHTEHDRQLKDVYSPLLGGVCIRYFCL